MPKKPEETLKKPTHGPKAEKGLGAIKTADKSTTVITHKHERKARVERDCTKCKYATQTGDNEWECSKEHYFPQTLLCFAPKTDEAKI